MLSCAGASFVGEAARATACHPRNMPGEYVKESVAGVGGPVATLQMPELPTRPQVSFGPASLDRRATAAGRAGARRARGLTINSSLRTDGCGESGGGDHNHPPFPRTPPPWIPARRPSAYPFAGWQPGTMRGKAKSQRRRASVRSALENATRRPFSFVTHGDLMHFEYGGRDAEEGVEDAALDRPSVTEETKDGEAGEVAGPLSAAPTNDSLSKGAPCHVIRPPSAVVRTQRHVFSMAKKKRLVYLVSVAAVLSPLATTAYLPALRDISNVRSHERLSPAD